MLALKTLKVTLALKGRKRTTELKAPWLEVHAQVCARATLWPHIMVRRKYNTFRAQIWQYLKPIKTCTPLKYVDH